MMKIIEQRDRYSGDDPAALADEIDYALEHYGLGADTRMFSAIRFFEGELRLIAKALREMAHAEAKNRRKSKS